MQKSNSTASTSLNDFRLKTALNRNVKAQQKPIKTGNSNSSISKHQQLDSRLKYRSKQLSYCLTCLIGGIFTLSPLITTLHLNNHLGLLIFEADLILLRASFINVIICSILLVIFHSLIFLYSTFIITRQQGSSLIRWRQEKTARYIQKLCKYLIGFFASLSALTYLSIGLFLDPIKQVQRMPSATFDCNANMITIENCYQQFAFGRSHGSSNTLSTSTSTSGNQHQTNSNNLVKDLLFSDLSEQNSRLIKQLNCLKYNPSKEASSSSSFMNDEVPLNQQVPTRFLLHDCGLVCKPHRQQIHQFSDDLNRDQLIGSSIEYASTTTTEKPSILKGTSFIETADMNVEASMKPDMMMNEREQEQLHHVNLKVCFSGDLNSGSSYKQFCITNLANGPQTKRGLTVGQLNAVLKRFVRLDSGSMGDSPRSQLSNGDFDTVSLGGLSNASDDNEHSESSSPKYTRSANHINDQATHFMNPLVQFESLFKPTNESITEAKVIGNKPSSYSDSMDKMVNDADAKWCKFRPIPPFIVNNKPFSDIQCSIEHQYTLSTQNSQAQSSLSHQDKIFLLKTSENANAESNYSLINKDRCNIKCKVNILYQIYRDNNSMQKSTDGKRLSISAKQLVNDIHYYLPLKPCLIVFDMQIKKQTIDKYMIYRSLGDSSFLLALLMLDLLLLIESIDFRQAQLENRKSRLIGLICVIIITPFVISLLMDLTNYQKIPDAMTNKSSQSQQSNLKTDRILHTTIELISSIVDKLIHTTTKSKANITSGFSNLDAADRDRQFRLRDLNYFDIPFLIYAVMLLLMTYYSFTLPIVTSTSQIFRISSFEELGLAGSKPNLNSKEVISPNKPKENLYKIGSISSIFKSMTDPSMKTQTSNWKMNTIDIITFILLTLFMGIQSTLSQTLPVHIIMDSMGNPLASVNNLPIVWFSMRAYLGAPVCILICCILFGDEISSLFAKFNPFDKTLSASLMASKSQRNRLKLLQYSSISLIIYSIQFYLLANLNSVWNSLRNFLLFIYHLFVLFNVPIVWFTLTGHAQSSLQTQFERVLSWELTTPINQSNDLSEEQRLDGNGSPLYDSQQINRNKRRRPKWWALKFNIHLVIQSSMGFLYVAMGRLGALMCHSLFMSNHLHNDDIDWFIKSFYSRPDVANATTATSKSKLMPPGLVSAGGSAPNLTTSGGFATTQSRPESLFSPLPSDQQTYLYATRLFLKYNSIICLIMGSILLVNWMYLRYKLWLIRRSCKQISLSTMKKSQSEDRSEDINERIRQDLLRIHNDDRQIFEYTTSQPMIVDDLESQSSLAETDLSDRRRQTLIKKFDERPRAKVLFHYDTKNESQIDSPSEMLTDAKFIPTVTEQVIELEGNEKEDLSDDGATHIPIQIIDEETKTSFKPEKDSSSITDRDDNLTSKLEYASKSFRQHQRKQKIIYRDEEKWSPIEEISSEEEENERIVMERVFNKRLSTINDDKNNNRKINITSNPTDWTIGEDEGDRPRQRTIKFAPTAILVGTSSSGSGSPRTLYSSTNGSVAMRNSGYATRASPEPSIGADSDEDY